MEPPPPYSKPAAPMGQITYSAPTAPPLPIEEQAYVGPCLPPASEKIANVQVVRTSIPPQQIVVGQQALTTPSRSSCTTWMNCVMIVALLVLIPGGAGLWYQGSLKNKTSLKIAGVCLQGFSFVVVELLQLLWYLHEKNAFLNANVTLVR
ncbi:hypothetical protein ACHWQZ_G016192 [Mnemiopsis leidyi]